MLILFVNSNANFFYAAPAAEIWAKKNPHGAGLVEGQAEVRMLKW